MQEDIQLFSLLVTLITTAININATVIIKFGYVFGLNRLSREVTVGVN